MYKLMFAIALIASPAFAITPAREQALVELAKDQCPKINAVAMQSKNPKAAVDAFVSNLEGLSTEDKLFVLGLCTMYERGYIDGLEVQA